MSAQDRTLDQYHELMQINAVSHILRAAREIGLLDRLSQGQHTAEQLYAACSLNPASAPLLLDALLSVGVVQRYGDDFALSPAAQLLCQHDHDLGDSHWRKLSDDVRGATPDDAGNLREHYDHIAATQWIHTPAAMQAAEILDVANLEVDSLRLLDLGCGSAVWSCAIAYAQPALQMVLVDEPESLAAAIRTASSINLTARVETVSGDPLSVDLSDQSPFDFVLLAQRLHALDEERGDALIARAVSMLKPGARLIVVDLFRGPTQANLSESVEALKLRLQTPAGQMRSFDESQQRLQRAGLTNVQFTFIASSRVNLGLVVGEMPSES